MISHFCKTLSLPLFAAMLATVLVACSTTQEKVDIPSTPADTVELNDNQGDAGTGSDVGSGASSTSLVNVGRLPRNAINDPNSPLSQRIVYFDFDQSTVLPAYQVVIDNHAEYLASYPDVRVRLEGHADERGSREYNIALGERRATSVRQLLLLQGVSAAQIDILSYGEELPVALAHDEEAWALNRRVEFVYLNQ